MSVQINQSKFFNRISVEIIHERNIIKFRNKRFFRFHSSEIPLEHINPEETQGSKINFTFFLVSLALIGIGLMWIFDCLIHLRLTGISNVLDAALMNLLALAVGGLGIAFTLGGILTMFNVFAESGRMAHFRNYIDNQPLLFFFCSKKYEAEYLAFKEELLRTIENFRNNKTLKEFISKIDNEGLLNIFPMVIVPEMKKRGFDFAKYIGLLSKDIEIKKADNVVSIISGHEN